MPGYFLNDYDQAARILDDLANPRIGLQFDLWHAARLHGDAGAVWEDAPPPDQPCADRRLSRPERTGRRRLLAARPVRRRSTRLPDVWIAAEYRPAKGTAQGLGWLTALKSRERADRGRLRPRRLPHSCPPRQCRIPLVPRPAHR